MTTALEAARCLADLLERENAALELMDLRRATALLPEKTAALANLAASRGVAQPGLVYAARRLETLARVNRCLLERAITAQRRLIGIVVRAALSASSAAPAYRGPGRPAQATAPLALSTRA